MSSSYPSCPKCRSNLERDSYFCPSCGYAIGVNKAAQTNKSPVLSVLDHLRKIQIAGSIWIATLISYFVCVPQISEAVDDLEYWQKTYTLAKEGYDLALENPLIISKSYWSSEVASRLSGLNATYLTIGINSVIIAVFTILSAVSAYFFFQQKKAH